LKKEKKAFEEIEQAYCFRISQESKGYSWGLFLFLEIEILRM